VVFWATVQVSGDTVLFEHEIDDEIVDSTVQVEAVVKSNNVPLAVPCAMKVPVVNPFNASTGQVRGVEPLEQEVVAPKVPMHT